MTQDAMAVAPAFTEFEEVQYLTKKVESLRARFREQMDELHTLDIVIKRSEVRSPNEECLLRGYQLQLMSERYQVGQLIDEFELALFGLPPLCSRCSGSKRGPLNDRSCSHFGGTGLEGRGGSSERMGNARSRTPEGA